MSHTHEFVIAEAEKTRCSQQKMARDKMMAEAEEMSSFLAGMGQRCDPELQEELREFVLTQGEDGRELALCLGPESARPLWQLGLLGLLANKGAQQSSSRRGCHRSRPRPARCTCSRSSTR